jgi:hypothetical protein
MCYDMCGIGMTVLDLLSPTGTPAVLKAETYGIEGEFCSPGNREGLYQAWLAQLRRTDDPWGWVEAHYPLETQLMLGDHPELKDFILK